MKRWCVPAISAALLFAACGDDKTVPPGDTGAGDAGGSASADGGRGGDAAAEVDDTDATCGRGMVGGTAEGDGCTATQSYSCGASKYEIVCRCPAATCSCTKNGVEVGTATWTGCSSGQNSCTMTFVGVAAQCGIPSSGGGVGVGVPPSPDGG